MDRKRSSFGGDKSKPAQTRDREERPSRPQQQQRGGDMDRRRGPDDGQRRFNNDDRLGSKPFEQQQPRRFNNNSDDRRDSKPFDRRESKPFEQRRFNNNDHDRRESKPFDRRESKPQHTKPTFSYSKRGGDGDDFANQAGRQRDRNYNTNDRTAPTSRDNNDRPARTRRPAPFAAMDSDAENGDIPTIQVEERPERSAGGRTAGGPSYQFQIERPLFTAEELQQFKRIQKQQTQRIQESAKYSTYLGTAEQNVAYKPFINAVHNLGGITQFQLYQLHLYTQCLLASQRHKITLASLNDGYYNNQVFPPVPDYFPHLNVTALRRPDLIFNHHLADALSIIPTIEAHVPELHTSTVKRSIAQGNPPNDVPLEIVDVGSGGGVPAIILAIMRPAWKITAIDSVGKKCNFLRHTADRLGLGNFTVISGDVQHYCNKLDGVQIMAHPLAPMQQYGNSIGEETHISSLSMFEAYDICVARGVTQMPALLPICMPLVKPGGKFIAMKSLLSSLPQEERQKYLERADAAKEAKAQQEIDSGNDGINADPEVKAKKAEIANMYKTMSGEDGGLEVDMTEFINQANKELEALIAKKKAIAAKKGDKNAVGESKKAQEVKKVDGDKGEKFKRAQADAATQIDDFEKVVESVLGTPWIASGRHSNAYAKLSLELQQSLPTLEKYGCGSNAKPTFVHTDLFFQVAPALKNKGIIPDPDPFYNTATKPQIDQVLSQYHPYLFDKSLPSPFKDQVEGKAGETAKYLCVIDKVSSRSNSQRNTLSKGVKQTTTTGVPIPKKPKPLSERDFVRASQGYEFLSPDAAVGGDEDFVPANPKIQLRKKFQQDTHNVAKFIEDNKEIMPKPKPKVNTGKPQWKIDRDDSKVQ